MVSGILVKSCSVELLSFKNIHSAGTFLSYDHPCIGYIKKGAGKFLYKGTSYFAEAGDLIYIAKGTKYYSVWTGFPDIEFYSINYDFYSPYTFYNFRFQIIKDFPAEDLDRFYQYFGDNNLLAISSFYKMLAVLYSDMQEEKVSDSRRAVEPTIAYIENHFSEPVSITQLCRLCHCSESWLFKTFRAATGVSPIAYKHNILIQHALDMLTNTTLPIEEISSRLGFTSANYFRRVFFKITGKTPREIRKNMV